MVETATGRQESTPHPELFRTYTRGKLLKILRWYAQVSAQYHDGDIGTLIELLPNAQTRRSYELGLKVIANAGQTVEGVYDIRKAEVWKTGDELSYRYERAHVQQAA